MNIIKGLRAISYVFLLLAPTLTFAQSENAILMDLRNRVTGGDAAKMFTRAANYYDVKGTPYINETWVSGTIYDNRGSKHENTPLLYNAHYDLVEAVVGRDTLILDSRKITKVEFKLDWTMGNRPILLKNGFSNAKEKIEPHMFFEVLHEGEQFTLLKKHYKNLKKADFNPAYNTGSNYDEFLYVTTLYIRDANGNISKLKANKKNVLGLFGSKSKEVENYANTNKLKFDKDLDLGAIFAYFENL